MLTHELPKAYSANDWEDKLYALWEESGFFDPDTCLKEGLASENAPVFSIVLPPPNVTGILHAGHATMLAIQDAFVRFHRMRGDRTLWIPGTDHAAIATQSKVEKIVQEEGTTRQSLGREAFLARVEAFAQESHDTIIHQTKKMGSSLDWSREAYTLDDARSMAVRKAFKAMYDDGLITRGDRIVNWDPEGQTTISDDEVNYRESADTFYYFQYGPFVIGTARPETKFGDKYVVMHPEDERYAEYQHGQKIELEWINGPITATVIKDEAIDKEFGTGAMTITPWHSQADFEIAERHRLDKEQIIDTDGKLLPIAQEFAGLHITEARAKIVAKLAAKGLLVKQEDGYLHQVATAERTGGMVEPQIMRQWFIDVDKPFTRQGREVTLKSLMQEAVRSGAVDILPERFEKIYFHWVDNLRPWCISRQIWFGHRIPVWYRGEETYCGVEAPVGDGWEQDPDTLDTWFSSGLWTFSTLGWGSDEAKWEQEKTYHPTALLETGYDILFFWVARMILMSEYFLEEPPFKTVYLHGLVRAADGRKMSKSLDNFVDPLDVISTHGADALRLALVYGSTPGNDLKLSDEKILTMRNFVNKLWNMSRYVLMAEGETSPELSLADRWILQRLATVTQVVTEHMEKYQISLATETLREFTVSDFADWYIEINKIEKNIPVLRSVMETLLKLWHPFLPFVTEAIWSHLEKPQLLLATDWPTAESSEEESLLADFETLRTFVTQVRNLRALYRIAPKALLTVILPENSFFQNNKKLLEAMAHVQFEFADETTHIPGSARLVDPAYAAQVSLEGVIDLEAEKKRLEKEIEAAKKHTSSLAARLQDESFRSKAPQEIIQAQEATLADLGKKKADLETALAALS